MSWRKNAPQTSCSNSSSNASARAGESLSPKLIDLGERGAQKLIGLFDVPFVIQTRKLLAEKVSFPS
jgi:hypothetical protein